MILDRRLIAIAIAIGMGAGAWVGSHWFGTAGSMLIVLCALLGAVGLMLTLGRTRGAVVALLVTAALNGYSAEITGLSMRPEHLTAMIVAVVLIPDIRRLIRRLDLISILLLIWLGWSAIGGVLNAPDPADSTRLWVMLMFAAFPFFVIFITTGTTGRLRFVVDSWLVIGIIIGGYGLLMHLLFAWGVDLGIQVNPVTRDPVVQATFREANLFGSAMMMLALAALAVLAFGRQRRPIVWLAALVGILGLQVSFTRTAWIGFAVGLLILILLKAITWYRAQPEYQRRPVRLRPIGLFVLAILVGTAMIWSPVGDSATHAEAELAARERATATQAAKDELTQTAEIRTPEPTINPLAENTPTGIAGAPTIVAEDPDVVARVASISDMSDASVQVRVEFAKRGLADWKGHPIIGVGIGSFGQKYTTSSYNRAWLSNVFVRFLHDGGIVGLVLFLAPMVLLAWRTIQVAMRTSSTETQAIALAFGVAIAAMFVAFQATEGFQLAWYWASMGILVTAVALAGKQAAA